jgi:hypothetical protein
MAQVTDEPAAARYFVALYDPSGVMMTAQKYREHLSLADARALQAEATKHGAMLLIYKEDPPKRGDAGHTTPR